jgi:hypothetical protein
MFNLCPQESFHSHKKAHYRDDKADFPSFWFSLLMMRKESAGVNEWLQLDLEMKTFFFGTAIHRCCWYCPGEASEHGLVSSLLVVSNPSRTDCIPQCPKRLLMLFPSPSNRPTVLDRPQIPPLTNLIGSERAVGSTSKQPPP